MHIQSSPGSGETCPRVTPTEHRRNVVPGA
jgi:hypothetical protein